MIPGGFQYPEWEHRYGNRVHLLWSPLLLTYLAELGSPQCTQPRINELVRMIYHEMFSIAANRELPVVEAEVETRMHAFHPEGFYRGPLLDRKAPAVTVNLARAGTVPSQVVYDRLNYLLDPSVVRQDHISIARATDAQDKVVGAALSGHKIGGSVEGATLFIPDPMGATGGTIEKTMEIYGAFGKPSKVVAIHCIVTPEYLKRITGLFPSVEIYAARLDRGLSDPKILDSVPGSHWDQEKGLNDRSYIVPGAGGLGEIMNNAYV